MNEQQGGFSRRSLAKGAAWAVRTVALAGAAPAMAASSDIISGSVCGITYDDGTASTQNMRVYLGVNTSSGVIPAGTDITWTVAQSGGTAGTNEVPSTNYSQNNTWTMTTSGTAGTASSGYTVTIHFNQDMTVGTGASTWCAAELLYTDVYAIGPGANITVTSNAPTGPVTSGGAGSLKWTLPRRHSTSGTNGLQTIAMRYASKSGTQSCYPAVTYLYKSGTVAAEGTNGSTCGDGGNNSSTIYPDGTCRKVNITAGQATIPAVCA